MVSPDPQTLHQGELELLITDLVHAGFEPLSGDRHNWVGPIRDSLTSLTAAREMRLELRDGWPYRHPYVFVDGLTGRKHVNAFGNTCLWFEDDAYWGDWLRLETIFARIDAWVADQEAGVSEPALDAHLYLNAGVAGLLTVDLDGLIARGRVDPVSGAAGLLKADQARRVFAVGERGGLDAAWLWIRPPSAPPSDVTRLRDMLNLTQRRTYDRVTSGVSRSRPGVLLLLWGDRGATNALAVKAERGGPGSYRLVPLEVARTDASVMRLRSGPDADVLAAVSVLIFGVGAVGSEIAMLLVRSGLRRLTLADGEVLRPGNLSRHAASGRYVGMNKPEAMQSTLRDAFADVEIKTIGSYLWDPSLVAATADGLDLIVDATGNAAYTEMLSRIAVDEQTPLVAAALHRSGRLARVRVQVGEDRPIWARSPENGYPDVPADPVPAPATWETGCGAPVNNAPPVAVTAAAALATRAIVDVLANRNHRERDIYDVYEAIEAPFAHAGPLEFGRSA